MARLLDRSALGLPEWMFLVTAGLVGWLVIGAVAVFAWRITRRQPRVLRAFILGYLLVSGLAGTWGLATYASDAIRIGLVIAPWTPLLMFAGFALLWPYLLLWALISNN